MNSLLKGVIRNGRVEVAEPIDLPEGTEVVVALGGAGLDDGPVSPDEIARVLAAMQRLRPLEIPDAVEADLKAWELQLTRHGLEYSDASSEDVFR